MLVGGGAKQNTHPCSCCMRQSAHFSLLSAAVWKLAEAAAQRRTKPRLQSCARAAGEQTSDSNLCPTTTLLPRTHGSGGFAGRSSIELWSSTLKPGRSRRTTTRSSGENKSHLIFRFYCCRGSFVSLMFLLSHQAPGKGLKNQASLVETTSFEEGETTFSLKKSHSLNGRQTPASFNH